MSTTRTLVVCIVICVLFTTPTFSREVSSHSSKVLYVGGVGPGNYTSIQDAIREAGDGYIIFVYDDSSPYRENLIIDKSIVLVGENKETTIIDGMGKKYVITVLADGVRISGFTITNSSKKAGEGIRLRSSNCTISDNIIVGNWVGIEVRNAMNNSILNDEFVNNSLVFAFSNGNKVSNCTFTESNLDIYNSINNIIISNKFIRCGVELSYALPKAHNTILDNSVNGKPLIYLEDGKNIEIKDAGQVILVRCEDIVLKGINIHSVPTAIRILNSRRVAVTNNNLSENMVGISVDLSTDINISNNFLIGNTCAGIWVCHASSSIEVVGNTVLNNDKGLYVYNCFGKVTIKNNVFKNNSIGLDIRTNRCIITKNNIQMNKKYGIRLMHGYNLIYKNNFEKNAQNAYFECFRELGINKWSFGGKGNYWEDWSGKGPYVIRGKRWISLLFFYSTIPWFNFDFFPAKEPYNISN